MKRAQQTLASMREQIAADDGRILQLQAQLQEEKNKKPEATASLPWSDAQQMLASAEQTSTELLERAKQDASPSVPRSGSGPKH